MQSLDDYVSLQRKSFENILKGNILVFDSSTSIFIATPSKLQTDLYQIDIPLLVLKDRVGYIEGNAIYDLESKTPKARSYSFKFSHLHTFITVSESRQGYCPSRENYSFHYDYDSRRKDEARHPLYHLQLTDVLRVPRFSVPKLEPAPALHYLLKMIEVQIIPKQYLSQVH